VRLPLRETALVAIHIAKAESRSGRSTQLFRTVSLVAGTSAIVNRCFCPTPLSAFAELRANRPSAKASFAVGTNFPNTCGRRLSFGRPIIAGTNIATSIIAERYKAGESMEELAKDYGCRREQVEEAVRCELALAA